MYELYGPHAAGDLLGALSRTLTAYLQMRGMTCGLDDCVLLAATEAARSKLAAGADAAAAGVAAVYAEVPGRDELVVRFVSKYSQQRKNRGNFSLALTPPSRRPPGRRWSGGCGSGRARRLASTCGQRGL